ncbi:hypothetical protein [Paenibacillus sp. FSL H7-0331]|uniref:hypothetical protein n=1 Tax=Paenibacillus sp. FSL H7-0331 TaxID=1920421 RepID=UPI0015C345BE|nr:hypothetical protein [Paenibacillus sp. FSL H7-0331]
MENTKASRLRNFEDFKELKKFKDTKRFKDHEGFKDYKETYRENERGLSPGLENSLSAWYIRGVSFGKL